MPARKHLDADPAPAVRLPADARVLVIDGDDAGTRHVEGALARAGLADVRTTTDPSRVAALCADWRPDLVLLDLELPGRDAIEVLGELAALRDADERVPVLVLTAGASADARLRAVGAGATDFLAKPVDPLEAVLRVRNVLAARASRRAPAVPDTLLEQQVEQRTRELEEAQIEILDRLAAAAEFRDDETGQHTQRVGELAARLATALGLPAEQVELIRRTAPLHDLGKIAIPDAVLRKPSKLSPGEVTVMRAHTTFGARILSGGVSPLVQMAERIARSHHERWDGSGYPDGLRGEQIPLEARIVAVADVVDALTHARPYRTPWSLQNVVDLVRAGRGRHFDPAVADAMLGESCMGYVHGVIARQPAARVPAAPGARAGLVRPDLAPAG